MRSLLRFIFMVVTFFGMSSAFASLIIPVYLTSGYGKTNIGTVKADDTIYGLMLTPNLKGLPPGVHGFHIHDLGSCGNHGMSAGGHLDPDHNKQHAGPFNGTGHLGDLPVLIVDAKGNATLPVVAPRLKLDNIKGHSLMIHEGGDNYSDKPEQLGGGGMRIACGVIPYY